MLIQLGLVQGLDSWAQAGGTSLSSSLIDVTTGSDGTCAPAYLCTAGRHYDGPTRNGPPLGDAGF
jgi:hypothetical protein